MSGIWFERVTNVIVLGFYLTTLFAWAMRAHNNTR